MAFTTAMYWCKRRILYHNGELNLRKKVIDYPPFITPIIMLMISYTSSNMQVGVIAFIISLESAILVTGLAQTVLKLKLAKKLSAEKYLPKYKP